jgi:hypothetical protein
MSKSYLSYFDVEFPLNSLEFPAIPRNYGKFQGNSQELWGNSQDKDVKKLVRLVWVSLG